MLNPDAEIARFVWDVVKIIASPVTDRIEAVKQHWLWTR